MGGGGGESAGRNRRAPLSSLSSEEAEPEVTRWRGPERERPASRGPHSRAPGLPCAPAAGAMPEPPRDARQAPRSSKACRCLFGPVDSEQLRQDCDALMASCVQEARERWNFDLVSETPLEGDFAWERVRGLGLPKLYLPVGPRDDLGGGKRPSPSSALLQGASQEDHLDLALSCTLVTRSPERPEGTPGGPGPSQGRKRRQTSMTGEDSQNSRCKGSPVWPSLLIALRGETGPERGSGLPEVTQQVYYQDQLADVYLEH